MKRTGSIGRCVLVAMGALLAQPVAVLADEGSPRPHASMEGYGRDFDWMQHTQQTLDELKSKLNLTPDQMTPWGIWSGSVIKDARQQLEQYQSRHEEEEGAPGPMADMTTPERMARGIEHLRAEANWVQEHLVQLEAAQVRTKTFYDTLSTNQKTIFDLFWGEMHHRVSGLDDGWRMREQADHVRGPMMRDHASPQAGAERH